MELEAVSVLTPGIVSFKATLLGENGDGQKYAQRGPGLLRSPRVSRRKTGFSAAA